MWPPDFLFKLRWAVRELPTQLVKVSLQTLSSQHQEVTSSDRWYPTRVDLLQICGCPGLWIWWFGPRPAQGTEKLREEQLAIVEAQIQARENWLNQITDLFSLNWGKPSLKTILYNTKSQIESGIQDLEDKIEKTRILCLTSFPVLQR